MVHSDRQASTKTQFRNGSRLVHAGLTGVLLLYCVMSCVGITWGLPSRKIDPLLFGDGEAWSGEKIYRLARAGEKFSADRISCTGADVDVDPIGANRSISPSPRPLEGEGVVVPLTETEGDVAKIYLRYRLYTYQPDEMITMMALAGMRPGELQLDPRLYQYGGLFIYPVGALIKLCGMLGLIDVRSDIVFYLDHPDEFGKFYVVARAYSAAWGLIGVIVVFALTRRIAEAIRTPSASEGRGEWRMANGEDRMKCGDIAGLVAALLFALMPVVVCMAHEGKPHLPGAVLMLLSVYLAIRAVADNRQSTIGNRKSFWIMCVCCGAAVGMVLSSWPICVLILLVAIIRSRGAEQGLYRIIGATLAGAGLAIAVYFATNPYVVINFFTNRDILRSNFGNSLAMYEVARIGEGLLRVLELTEEGATLPVMFVGMIAIIIGFATCVRRTNSFWLLVVPASLFFAQFVLIGADKPAEYGRFGIFSNTTLAVATAVLLASVRWNWFVKSFAMTVLAFVAYGGLGYDHGFYVDATESTSRIRATRHIAERLNPILPSVPEPLILVPVEPAPYCCPPLDFAAHHVTLAGEETLASMKEPFLMVQTDDRSHSTPISWANKRFWVRTSDDRRTWKLPYRPE